MVEIRYVVRTTRRKSSQVGGRSICRYLKNNRAFITSVHYQDFEVLTHLQPSVASTSIEQGKVRSSKFNVMTQSKQNGTSQRRVHSDPEVVTHSIPCI